MSRGRYAVLVGCIALVGTSCTGVFPPSSTEGDGAATEISQRAREIAEQIGGVDGFGGIWMDGYRSHMPVDMGFRGTMDLADPDGTVVLQLVNDSSRRGTFYPAYLLGGNALNEEVEEVAVEPGETVEFELPCAEILGMGSLDLVGAVAVQLQDGTELDNRWCVPGFLNADYACGGVYTCALAPDTNDLDGDGDFEELVVATGGLWEHMTPGGMAPHSWGINGGMMMGGHGPMMSGFRP